MVRTTTSGRTKRWTVGADRPFAQWMIPRGDRGNRNRSAAQTECRGGLKPLIRHSTDACCARTQPECLTQNAQSAETYHT